MKFIKKVKEFESCEKHELPASIYGVVEWIQGHPILNGMKYFTSKRKALEYANALPKIIYRTIIELVPGEEGE
jgi:hypothetical protein